VVTADGLAAAASLPEGRFPLSALWLFGSQARGEARSDSDVDLSSSGHARKQSRHALGEDPFFHDEAEH
jgi:predicted nucleotidyltransferase